MPYEVKPAEDTMLRSLYIFPYMTGKQLTQLLYSRGSYKEVLAKLKRLTDNGYVLRKPLPSQIQSGSVPYVYWLADTGRKYLKGLGYDFTNWRHPSEMKLVHSAHFWHALSVNDFLIAGANIANTHPDLTLVDIRHDLIISRNMQLPCRCDGWMDFRIRNKEQQCLWLELDRGTEKVKVFKEKVACLVTYAKGNYERDFGTPSITIAFATTELEHRGGEMRSWCEQVLTAMNMIYEADLFRFLALPEQYDPEWLYLAPVWEKPFDSGKSALLEIG